MGGINPAHKKSPLLTINEKKAIFITTFEHLARKHKWILDYSTMKKIHQ